jgi:hypothetical protein
MHRGQRPGNTSERIGTVHPTELAAGTQVDGWRTLWRHEMGTFGVVYLAVRVGHEAAGPCALKLARSRGDARLEREVGLLQRVTHPNVPRLLGHGEWYGFPYVVMEWVEGPALYRWAQSDNPSLRRAMELLAKMASALAAVHAVGGAHRDMKGDNVLVRLADGAPMLTDFGAGIWEGATPLTVQGPPGTPLYFSPERLRTHLSLLPPGSRTGAGPADDVYGLGVTAFRLLTDSYPFLEIEEAQRTHVRLEGKPPRAPHELNPSVPRELSTLVLRMMEAQLEQRPSAAEVARAVEAMMQGPRELRDERLFAWEEAPSRMGPGRRLRSRVEYERWLVHARLEEGQARVAAEVSRVQARRQPFHAPNTAPPPLHRRTSARFRRRRLPWSHVAGAVLKLSGLAALLLGLLWGLARGTAHMAALGGKAEQNESTVGLGDTALSAAPAASSGAPSSESSMEEDMTGKSLPKQKRPPCSPRWEVEFDGGCWFKHTAKAPCRVGEHERDGHCYLPVQDQGRPTTSDQP